MRRPLRPTLPFRRFCLTICLFCPFPASLPRPPSRSPHRRRPARHHALGMGSDDPGHRRKSCRSAGGTLFRLRREGAGACADDHLPRRRRSKYVAESPSPDVQILEHTRTLEHKPAARASLTKRVTAHTQRATTAEEHLIYLTNHYTSPSTTQTHEIAPERLRLVACTHLGQSRMARFAAVDRCKAWTSF